MCTERNPLWENHPLSLATVDDVLIAWAKWKTRSPLDEIWPGPAGLSNPGGKEANPDDEEETLFLYESWLLVSHSIETAKGAKLWPKLLEEMLLHLYGDIPMPMETFRVLEPGQQVPECFQSLGWDEESLKKAMLRRVRVAIKKELALIA